MLERRTVDPKTLELLEELMLLPELREFCLAGGAVEVDLLKFSYPFLKPIVKEGNIRMLAMEDIAAMKLSAIAGRGSKKDFYDIYYLLHKFDLEELFGFFAGKFPTTNTFQIIKSLTYFDDADVEPDPITYEPVDWELVKRTITEKLEKYLHSV